MDSIPSAPSPSSASAFDLPPVIQGGMGVGVSGWRLARAVSLQGQLGVVSGTAIDAVLARQLQLGDTEGHLRRALAALPIPGMAERILSRYFRPDGKNPEEGFRPHPMVSNAPAKLAADLLIAGSFTAVFLAKENHGGVVGINLLEKIQTPTLLALFGAMLAGVDVVLMGAGIPRQIPGILDKLAEGQAVDMRLDVTDASEPVRIHLDPSEWFSEPPVLRRPYFLAIVSSSVLAENLRRKASGKVDGFVVEAACAGGHNAPPRGPMKLDERGEPIYGPRDAIEPAAFRAIGLPFWLAGGYGHPGGMKEAQALGAQGVQVGTAFALCEESGFEPGLKARILASARQGTLPVRTDALASPTGFPFKVAMLPGTMAESTIHQSRTRVCDLGVLRETYEKDDGSVGFRCAAEPIADYIRKGGTAEGAAGRMCLCNSLLASIGLGQVRDGEAEAALVTLGDDVPGALGLLPEGDSPPRAVDVLARLMA